ncbi:MAG TPA: 3-isopropylmalate dehydratase small subunit [Patescibacteria group bacterium]|nr:3-isopropylmalate dehydratase small subunit [Patescibacteria group bacterium]
MSGFVSITSRSVALPIANIDTDQIIPARYLTTTTRAGLGQHAFQDWRWRADGSPNPDFALNRPENAGAGILIAGDNFGCGSSREHAPWALLDAGIRAVISTAIADIFRSNALKNGLLALVVSPAEHASLLERAGETLSIDLRTQRVERTGAAPIAFAINAFARQCLLDGVDELGYLRARTDAIARFEGARA